MTSPDVDPAAALIGTGAKALVENAKRLGMIWTLRRATITDATPDAIKGTFDGGDEQPVPVGMFPMISPVFVDQRVYVAIVPPSGNFIIGSLTPSPYRATIRLSTQLGSINFVNLPTNLKFVKVFYRAQAQTGGAVRLLARINGVSTNSYRASLIGNNGAVAITPEDTGAVSTWVTGILVGNNTATEFSGGEITFTGWSAPNVNLNGYLSQNFHGSAYNSSVTGGFNRVGGGTFTGVGPYNRITFTADTGANFSIDTEFNLVGYY